MYKELIRKKRTDTKHYFYKTLFLQNIIFTNHYFYKTLFTKHYFTKHYFSKHYLQNIFYKTFYKTFLHKYLFQGRTNWELLSLDQRSELLWFQFPGRRCSVLILILKSTGKLLKSFLIIWQLLHDH